MPILARVGRRSVRMRIAVALVYTVLTLGAVTMLYPLVLMLSGSVRSDTDFAWVTPLPEYLFDDHVLWMKYVESKYGFLPWAEAAQHHTIASWRSVKTPEIDARARERTALFAEF